MVPYVVLQQMQKVQEMREHNNCRAALSLYIPRYKATQLTNITWNHQTDNCNLVMLLINISIYDVIMSLDVLSYTKVTGCLFVYVYVK